MKIKRTALPADSVGRVIIDTLGDSWYQKGLTAKDIGGLNAMGEKQVNKVLERLLDEGLVQIKTRLPGLASGYELTERCKELLSERDNDKV